MLPKDVQVLESLPTLATGKVDYVALRALVDADWTCEEAAA